MVFNFFEFTAIIKESEVINNRLFSASIPEDERWLLRFLISDLITYFKTNPAGYQGSAGFPDTFRLPGSVTSCPGLRF